MNYRLSSECLRYGQLGRCALSYARAVLDGVKGKVLHTLAGIREVSSHLSVHLAAEMETICYTSIRSGTRARPIQ